MTQDYKDGAEGADEGGVQIRRLVSLMQPAR